MSGQLSITANTNAGCTPLPVVISVQTPDPASITSYQWVVTFPNNASVTSSDDEYIGVFAQTGNYSVTLTINGSETLTETNFITVYQPPTAAIAVDDSAGCVPHCVQFSDASIAGGGQIVSWSWDFGNGTLSNQQNPTFCYQNAGNYTPFLSVQDENGCFNSVSVPQLVFVSNNPPVADFIPSTLNDCNPPVNVTFDNTSVGADLISTWSFGNGFTQTTVGLSTVNQTFDAVNDYLVCLTVENTIGCTSEHCETIEVVEPPTPQFTVSENTVCAGNFITFTDTSTPTPAQLSWDFDGDGIEDATGSTVSYQYTSPGTYTPILNATYSSNCVGQSSGDVSVTVLQALAPNFTASATAACALPATIDFLNTSSGQNILGYEWVINGTSAGTSTDLSYTFDAFGTYDVDLVMNTALCSDTLSLPDFITIAQPTINFNLPAQICTGVPVPVNNIVIDATEQVTAVGWDFDGDGIVDATGTNPAFSYDATGIYTVQVFLETVSGCTSTVSATQNIVVQPGVIADFQASATVSCADEPITFCTEMVQGTTYAWNFGGPWFNTSFPNECIEYTYQDTGFFDVTLSVYNTACNAIITLQDYIYIAPPIALFDFDQDCADLNTVQFTDASIGADSLIWDFGDGSPLIYDDLNPVHTFPAPGTYTVTLTAFNFETGCSDPVTQTVNTAVTPFALNAANATGCAPRTPTFSSPNSTQYVNWQIDFGNGTSSTVVLNAQNIWEVTTTGPNGTTFNTYSFFVNWWPQVTYTQQGTYDVTVIATDVSGCVYTQTFDDIVTVWNDEFFAGFNTTIIDGCDNVIVSFEPTGNFLLSGTWEFTDGTSSTEINPVHQFFAPWDYTFGATFTVTDQFGCSSTATQTIDLVPPPIPGFNIVADPSCIAEEITIENTSTGDIVSYFWDFGDPGTPDNTSTDFEPEHAYTQNGSFTVCLTVENSAGCQQTLCQNNAVNIISPIAEITYTPQINNCLFGVQYENTTAGDIVCSEWSFGDGQFGSGLDPFHTYSLGVYDVQLVVCNSFGCYDTTTVFDIFNLSNVIGPYTTTLDPYACAPFDVTFTAYNSADQSFNYFWDFGDGSGDPDDNTVTTHAYDTPGSYCPTLVMADQNGCTFLITCEEPIEVEEFTFEMSNVDPVCFGESSTFEVSGAESYQFSHPELITDLGGGNYQVDALQTTDILVTGFLSDCQQTQTLEVVINQLPEVQLDIVDEVCFNADVFALTGGWPQGNTGSYTVNGVETADFDPSQPAGTSYAVAYIYTDANGCSNTAMEDVFIHPLPVVTLDEFGPFCEADPDEVLVGGLPLGGTYSLNGVTSAVFTPSAGYGAYPLSYSYTDANGCSATAQTTVDVYPNPIPSITPPELCWQPSLTLESSSSIATGAIVDYAWDLDEAGIQTGSASATFSVAGPTLLNVTFTAISDQGCSSSVSVEVPVYATPEANFSVADICQGDAFALLDASTSNGEPIAEWVWSLNGSAFATGAQPTDVPIEAWGVMSLELLVTTTAGCSDSATESAFVAPLPVIDLSTAPTCENVLVTIQNASSLPGGGDLTYVWDDGQGNASNANNLSTTYTQFGNYTITLTAESAAGCISQSAVEQVVYATPIADFDWENVSFCALGNTVFTDLTSIGEGVISAWSWSANGNQFAQTPDAEFSAPDYGVYTITLEVVSNEGCSDAVTYTDLVEVYPNPQAGFVISPDPPISAAPYFFLSDRSNGADSWEYFISDGSVYSTPEFNHELNGSGVFAITQIVSNSFGCTDSLTVEYDLDPELLVYVPNAFTPDADGLNEVFIPVISGATLHSYRFFIVDRWGETVFETTDRNVGWIGDFRGGDHYVMGGVYVWQLEVSTLEKRFKQVFTGHVTIVR